VNRTLLVAGWVAVIGVAVGVRLWNALAGPLMWGYDAWGHAAYVLFLDLYRAVPWADQGWSYFHPPFHYALGWVLAQLGSGEVLMRGLSLLGSAASLGTAALAAWLVRLAAPDRPALSLLGFGAVAFLPVHFTLSPMPGNELTETFLTAAAVTAFAVNEGRARPSLRIDLVTAVLLGLTLLTKFSGLLPLVAIVAALGLRPLLWSRGSGEGWRSAGRAALIAGVALALSAPYYARNVATFGTPFQLSRDYPLVAQIERGQPPGVRVWRDYVSVPLALFSNPDPRAPHLLGSVWGSVYLNAWADTLRESDEVPTPAGERVTRRSASLMAVLGLVPSVLAVMGVGLAASDLWRSRRRPIYATLFLLAGASLAAFAVFTWRVPLWSALKASYLLALSLPFAVFTARAFEWLDEQRARWVQVGLGAWLVAAAAAASVIAASGAVLPPRADAPATGAVRFYFGEYEAARRVYGRLAAGAEYPVPWLENLAAVELADGHSERARRLTARALALGGPDPYRQGRLAVATALSGGIEAARDLLDEALAARELPELLVNRGAIRAALGDLAGAEIDLRRGLELAPDLVPGWLGLAETLERAGRSGEADAVRDSAVGAACRSPRGYPHGLGTGEVLEWGVGRRSMVLLEEGGLRVALPAFYGRACRRLREAPHPAS
jgi:tetratricopeptide (TPR) repeat protein